MVEALTWMKECNNCKKIKPLSSFGKLSKNKDGLNNKCKECKRTYDNKFHNSRSQSTKELKYEAQKLRVNNIRSFLNTYLDGKCCNQCGDSRKVVLEFHHLRDKEFNIADGIRKSINKIKKEIEKCEILCANCHRVVTAKERRYYKINESVL